MLMLLHIGLKGHTQSIKYIVLGQIPSTQLFGFVTPYLDHVCKKA